jgi:ubiquinone/menaquinone biosynthesis C-methylase UbiE
VEHPCPICGAPGTERDSIIGRDLLHGTPGTFQVVVCESCGAGRTLPEATDDALRAYYPDSYQAYALPGGVVGAAANAWWRLRLRFALGRYPLEALGSLPPGAVLDVGCGRGDMGAALVERGWRAVGIEPSESACEVARKRGMDVHQGTLGSVALDEEAFDAAIMSHSLEHMNDPPAALERVFRALRPGGVLVVSLPNFGSWQRERFGAAWFALDLPRHRVHFTPASLRTALADAGFDVGSLKTANDSWTLLGSLQYRTAGRLVLGRGLALRVGFAIAALLSPVSRLLDLVRGQPALLHAVARRPARAGADGR